MPPDSRIASAIFASAITVFQLRAVFGTPMPLSNFYGQLRRAEAVRCVEIGDLADDRDALAVLSRRRAALRPFPSSGLSVKDRPRAGTSGCDDRIRKRIVFDQLGPLAPRDGIDQLCRSRIPSCADFRDCLPRRSRRSSSMTGSHCRC